MRPSILDSSAVSCETFSQRLAAAPRSSASATLPSVVSNRCRLVMHSVELTTAYFSAGGASSDSRASSASTVALFPVASVPWMTRFRHGAAEG